MQGNASQRGAGGAESDSGGRLAFGPGKLIASLALCLMAAGCASIGQALGPSGLAASASARDVGIAFESIDGLPRDMSQKLVHDLDEEAAALRVAVVPPGGEATYRVRGYLAAHARGATTSIAWAWDVYDAQLQRAFRLSGEEEAGPSAGNAAARKGSEARGWTAADEAVLRRIARTGMQQLVDFMASAPAPAAPVAPGRRPRPRATGRTPWRALTMSRPTPLAASPNPAACRCRRGGRCWRRCPARPGSPMRPLGADALGADALSAGARKSGTTNPHVLPGSLRPCYQDRAGEPGHPACTLSMPVSG